MVTNLPSTAFARGTARAQESDGTIRTYHQVFIRIVDHHAVYITSADGRDTLMVHKSACTTAGQLERCLPYRITLLKSGVPHRIDLQRGIEYLNRTDTGQVLPHSSMRVPAHALLLSLLTAHGTTISVSGTIDGFVR
jgi:hypothetical protein